MDQEEQKAFLNKADRIATAMEQAIKLNGDGAHVIRELIDSLRNFQQIEQLWSVIADRYEKLVDEQDKLLQANLQLQKEMVKMTSRILRLEQQERDQSSHL